MIRRVTSVIDETAEEPIDFEDMNSWLRKTLTEDETTLVENLIKMCRDLFERTTGRTMILKTHTLYLDTIPGGVLPWWPGVVDGARTAEMGRSIDLDLPPAIEISSVSTFDVDNSEITWDADNYYLDNTDPEQIPRLCLNLGAVWPTNLRARDSLKIVFTAGYGEDFPLPDAMKLALMQMVTYYFNNRGDCAESVARQYAAPFVLADIMPRVEDGRPYGLHSSFTGEFPRG